MKSPMLKTLLLSAALAAALGVGATLPAAAQTIASKVEHQGDARYVKVTGLVAKERNGLLALQVELTNVDNTARRAFWRVKWLDDSGFQVWDDEPWKPVLVQGGSRQNLQSLAPTPKARDFRIQFNAEENWSNKPLGSD
ncbi:hypothetical protein DLREEDagrD3_12820 [Denitratisoma sp. agr-D3]